MPCSHGTLRIRWALSQECRPPRRIIIIMIIMVSAQGQLCYPNKVSFDCRSYLPSFCVMVLVLRIIIFVTFDQHTLENALPVIRLLKWSLSP